MSMRKPEDTSSDEVSFGPPGEEREHMRLPGLGAVGFLERFMRTRQGIVIGSAAVVALVSWGGVYFHNRGSELRQRHTAEATFERSVSEEMSDLVRDTMIQQVLLPGSFTAHRLGNTATEVDATLREGSKTLEIIALARNLHDSHNPDPNQAWYVDTRLTNRVGRSIVVTNVQFTAPKRPIVFAPVHASSSANPSAASNIWSAQHSTDVIRPSGKSHTSVTLATVGPGDSSTNSTNLQTIANEASDAAQQMMWESTATLVH